MNIDRVKVLAACLAQDLSFLEQNFTDIESDAQANYVSMLAQRAGELANEVDVPVTIEMGEPPPVENR